MKCPLCDFEVNKPEHKSGCSLGTFDLSLPFQLVDMKAAAQISRLTYGTVRSYRLGKCGFPEPDKFIGNKPLWQLRTLINWNLNRGGSDPHGN